MAQPKISYSRIMDNFFVVIIDGGRVGYALSEEDAKKVVSWLKNATEEIEFVRKPQ